MNAKLKAKKLTPLERRVEALLGQDKKFQTKVYDWKVKGKRLLIQKNMAYCVITPTTFNVIINDAWDLSAKKFTSGYFTSRDEAVLAVEDAIYNLL